MRTGAQQRQTELNGTHNISSSTVISPYCAKARCGRQEGCHELKLTYVWVCVFTCARKMNQMCLCYRMPGRAYAENTTKWVCVTEKVPRNSKLLFILSDSPSGNLRVGFGQDVRRL